MNMNRYLIEGVARDHAAGKKVIVVVPEHHLVSTMAGYLTGAGVPVAYGPRKVGPPEEENHVRVSSIDALPGWTGDVLVLVNITPDGRVFETLRALLVTGTEVIA